MTKLVIPPNEAAYTGTFGNEIVSVQLSGGASRSRLDILNAWRNITVQWSVSPSGYQYLMSFHRGVALKGIVPFTIDLIFDEAELVEYNAKFVVDTFRLSSVQGYTYTVDAQLEVYPVDDDFSYDQSFVDTYNEYGEQSDEIYLMLQELVNVQMPEDFNE